MFIMSVAVTHQDINGQSSIKPEKECAPSHSSQIFMVSFNVSEA